MTSPEFLFRDKITYGLMIKFFANTRDTHNTRIGCRGCCGCRVIF